MPSPLLPFEADPIIGRDAELSTLLARLEEARAGRGGLAVVAGEPGIGKSRLLDELAGHAANTGVTTLHARCYEGEGAPAFWPWTQIVRSAISGLDVSALRDRLGAGASDIAALVPELRVLLPELDAAPLPPSDQARFRLFEAITRFLGSIAASSPLLVIIDDLHWGDAPSLALLGFLAQSLSTLPLLLVTAYRDAAAEQPPAFGSVLTALRRTRGFRLIHLNGLTRDALTLLVDARAERGGPAFVEALHRMTDGNPLYVLETLRHLAETGRIGQEAEALAEIEVPEGVRGMIRQRTARLPEEARRVLSVASVVGQEFDLHVLSAAVESPGLPLLELLDEAVAARLVAVQDAVTPRYSFCHAAIRETLYADLPLASRVRLHHRVGAALEAAVGANAEPRLAELAWHFCRAAAAGDPEQGVRYAERAALRASRLHAHEEAASLYELALRTLSLKQPVDDERRFELLLALGQAHLTAGAYKPADDAFRAAAGIARGLVSGAGSSRAAVLLARAANGFGAHWQPLGVIDHERIALLREALHALAEDEPALRVQLYCRLAEALVQRTREEILGASSAALELARTTNDPAVLLRALSTRWGSLMNFGLNPERGAVSTEAFRLAEAAGDESLILVMRAWRIENLAEIGDVAGVERELAILSERARTLRLPFTRWRAASLRAMRALLGDDPHQAEAVIEEALALGTAIVGPVAVHTHAVQMQELDLLRGRLSELEARIAAMLAAQPGEPLWLCARTNILAHMGRHDEAAAIIEHLSPDEFAALPRSFGFTYALSFLAETCALIGGTHSAEVLYRLLAPFDGGTVLLVTGVVCRGAVSRYLGLLAATLRRWQDAARHFDDALTLHERMRSAPLLASTRCAYADMLAAWNREAPNSARLNHARTLATAVRTSAETLGLAALEERSVRLLDALTGPAASPAVEGLSAREVEVLRLLADGATNKEIGAALYLSADTVRQHTINIYRKLDVSGRAEATAWAARHGLLDT